MERHQLKHEQMKPTVKLTDISYSWYETRRSDITTAFQ